MQRILSICSLLLFASSSLQAAPSASIAPQVTLDTGTYQGLVKRIPGATQDVHVYLGVPFAAPPTRFAAPQLAPPSTAVRQATSYPPACIQAKNTTATESEDCLYLNIYSPVPDGKANKTVMIFLYGGGLQSGDASLTMYDGTSFATNQDVILVVPNYRTNGQYRLHVNLITHLTFHH
jgi:carboxylesterase type B